MKPSRTLALLLLCLLAPLAPGQDFVPVVPERDGMPRVRDPFWPVGYVPRKPARQLVKPKAAEAAKTAIPDAARLPLWDEARRSLDVRGISLIARDKDSGRPKFIAIIAGRLTEAGDTVSTTFENRIYRWRVVTIDRAGVTLQKMDVRSDEETVHGGKP